VARVISGWWNGKDGELMTITLQMDGREITVEDGKTLLDAAREQGIDVPTICFHEATTANGLCRMCVVEVEGMRLLQPACIVQAARDMKVKTRSDRVDRARKTILEMLASTMDLSDAPEILTMMDEYGAKAERFPGAERRESEIKDDNPMYIRDYSKCLLCWRCVQVCAEDAQYTYAINFDGRGYETQIGTFFDKSIPETTCVLCGQCVGVCPTGALKPKRQYLLEQGVSAEEISVMNTGRKQRRAKQAKE
jgi:NADH dehydrogenase/NADH:ubiquinone oxidoreductase subunit G